MKEIKLKLPSKGAVSVWVFNLEKEIVALLDRKQFLLDEMGVCNDKVGDLKEEQRELNALLDFLNRPEL